MTLSEFKAWFSGFTEDMDGPPNAKQWKRIQARVKEISGVALTERVFVNRYWPRPWRDFPYYSTCSSTGSLSAAPLGGPAEWKLENRAAERLTTDAVAFDSHTAMLALGKADYAEV